MHPFNNVISEENEFRRIIGHPGGRVITNTANKLEKHSKEFIAKASFCSSHQLVMLIY